MKANVTPEDVLATLRAGVTDAEVKRVWDELWKDSADWQGAPPRYVVAMTGEQAGTWPPLAVAYGSDDPEAARLAAVSLAGQAFELVPIGPANPLPAQWRSSAEPETS